MQITKRERTVEYVTIYDLTYLHYIVVAYMRSQMHIQDEAAQNKSRYAMYNTVGENKIHAPTQRNIFCALSLLFKSPILR